MVQQDIQRTLDTAVIMAAGRGTRMKQLTATTPKPLLSVDGKPLLLHALERLEKAGFKRVVVIVGYLHEQFGAVLSQASSGLQVQTVNQFDVTPKDHYGTAMAILAAEQAVENKPFVALAGDQLYGLSDLHQIRRDEPFYVMAVIPHEHPEEYGVAVVDDDGFLKEIAEKSENPPGNLVNMSLYRFLPDVFDVIRRTPQSPRGEYEITDVMSALAREKKVKIMQLDEPCMHISNPGDIDAAHTFVRMA